MKTLTFVFWIVCVAIAIPVTSFSQAIPRIVIITQGQSADSFWLIVGNGAEAAAEETNSRLEYMNPDRFDMTAGAQLIDGAVASKPEGLVVSIPAAVALGGSIRAAVAEIFAG